MYDGEDVNVQSTDGGKRIAVALGEGRGVILRNHGLLTVGGSVDEAIGWFIMMERVAEVHVKAHRPQPISDEAARTSARRDGAAADGMARLQLGAAGASTRPVGRRLRRRSVYVRRRP